MRTLRLSMVGAVILALCVWSDGLVLAQTAAETEEVTPSATVEYAPLPSIDPSLVPDADGFIFEELMPGIHRLVTDGAGHFPSATYIREARDMDELGVDDQGRVLVWSTTHGIDNDLAFDSQLWILGVDGVLSQSEAPVQPTDLASGQLAPDGSTWALGWDYGGGVIRSDGETAERFLTGHDLGSLAITPDGRVWVAEGHDDGEAGGIDMIESDAVGEPVDPSSLEPTDEEVFLPGPTTTDELLALAVTKEVEPGVFRVANDGLGPLDYPLDWEYPYDIVAGHDGGIYILEPGHYTRLGSGHYRGNHKGFDWDLVDAVSSDVEVAPDGTIWAVFEDGTDRYIYSTSWGSGHETRHLPTTGPDPIEVTSDGTVWAVWLDDPGDPASTVFGHLGADGWTMVGDWPFEGTLHVSDRGEVWAVSDLGWGIQEANRFVDGVWRTEELSLHHEGWVPTPPADVGLDGTLWGIRKDRLVHFDGTDWTSFEPPDWSRTDDAMRKLAEDGWVPDDFGLSRWGAPLVAPDGSLWVPPRLGVLGRDPDLGGGQQVVCGYGIDGVARFDGETWSRFLQGRCVEAMDIGADGLVWMLASKSDARFPLARTYVITPEAVAATE